MPTLWTKNFTILTLGSVISMLGNCLTGFAMSLLVLDYTGSAAYYAIYMVMFTLPQLIVPIFSGALLDRFSRRRTIYTLDFISAGLYVVAAVVLGTGFFNFAVLAVFCLLIGSINSIYTVAYESFYPLLITEGFFSKAYSIASVLETLTTVMIPVSAVVYNAVGIVPLFIFDGISFFVAAVLETRIDAEEKYIDVQKASETEEKSVGKRMLSDVKEGFLYMKTEKGLLIISVFFGIMSFAGGASQVITLPFFRANFENGEYYYILTWGMAVVGRGVAGFILYRIHLKAKYKYALAMTSYTVITLLEAFYLYTNIPFMMVACLFNGLLGVTSYTIRSSATQSYVPDEKKGRFNGAFFMLTTGGSVLGEMLAGSLVLVFPDRFVLTGFLLFNFLAAVILVGIVGRKAVRKVYETEK